MRNGFCGSCGKRPAEFTFSRVLSSGRCFEQDLCETCCTDIERIRLGDCGLMPTHLLKTFESKESFSEIKESRTKICPNCGNTVDEVREAGVLGCAECYAVFRDEVDRVIRQLHGYPWSPA